MFEANIHWLKFVSCVRDVLNSFQVSSQLSSQFFGFLLLFNIVLDIEVHNYLGIGFLKLNVFSK